MMLKTNQKIKIFGEVYKIEDSYELEDDVSISEIYELSDGSELLYDTSKKTWSFMKEEQGNFITTDIKQNDIKRI